MLGIFCKYYNKWFVLLQELIGWVVNKTAKELNNTRVIARLMEKSGITVKEVNLEKGRNWDPQQVCVF